MVSPYRRKISVVLTSSKPNFIIIRNINLSYLENEEIKGGNKVKLEIDKFISEVRDSYIV